jgi:hypothetical protein
MQATSAHRPDFATRISSSCQVKRISVCVCVCVCAERALPPSTPPVSEGGPDPIAIETFT